MNIDNTYDPTNISKNYLSGQEFTNQVSIEQGFNVELFEVSDKLAFIKNFGNVAVFKDGSKGLLIDTGMGVSSNQVINKLKEWGIDEIDEININDSEINLIHGKGETDDATYLYSEKEDAIFTGDFFIWSLPNAGNPSKAQRYVGSWGEVLKDMSQYNAEFLFPGLSVDLSFQVTAATAAASQQVSHLV